MIRSYCVSIVLWLALEAAAQADLITLDEIQLWAGTGSAGAGFAIDWTDGVTHQSYAWGYRWDPTTSAPTGADALTAIVNANLGLYSVTQPGTSFGLAVYGLGYDKNRNGIFGTTPPL